MSLYSEGRLDEAATLAVRLTNSYPDDATGWTVLGIVRHDQGQYAAAETCLRRALQAHADFPLALNSLGNVLQKQGRFDEAEASLRRVLAIQPGFAEAHNNLGNVLTALGRLTEAETCYRNAVALQPNFSLGHCNLGNTLRHFGRLDEAVASYRRAIELRVDYAEAHDGLGASLFDLGRFDEAEAFYRWSLSVRPGSIEAHNNLGNVLKAMNRLEEASRCYRHSLTLDPGSAELHNNLGNVLKDIGELEAAETHYRRAVDLRPSYSEAHSNLLFLLSFRAGVPPREYLAEARRFGERAAVSMPFAHWSRDVASRRLRVGFVSGDFINHPVGYFLESLLANIDTERLELFAYSSNPKTDDLTARIKPRFAAWKSIHHQSDAAVARTIQADGIHVLIDLSGHTGHNRLPVFAWKPAPVQVSWLGYFASTGLKEIDYLLADPWTLPPEHETNFSERIWRLPETRFCLTPPEEAGPVAALPALSEGCVTFGSFNNLTKVTDQVVTLWCRILDAVPGSRLLVKATQLREADSRQRLVQRFAACGIEADRLRLEGPTSRREYLTAYSQVDIALDPFPYTGGTTSAEALWMGVPVLTLAGDCLLSRQGVGLMMNAGLSEWIASDTEDYLVRAVRFAHDHPGLADLRQNLRQRMAVSPIFDALRFARHFEGALLGMWDEWLKSRRFF